MTMTTDQILLHPVPGDPVRERVREALGSVSPKPGNFLSAARSVAAELGISEDEALAAIGVKFFDAAEIRWEPDPRLGAFTAILPEPLTPDGVRACWAGECPHGPDYVPEVGPTTERTDR